MNNTQRYIIGSWVYGFARTMAYTPKLKEDDYVIDRIGKIIAWTGVAPICSPILFLTDLKNLEHKLRNMPGPINRFPW